MKLLILLVIASLCTFSNTQGYANDNTKIQTMRDVQTVVMPFSQLVDKDFLVGCNFRSKPFTYIYFANKDETHFTAAKKQVSIYPSKADAQRLAKPILTITGIKQQKSFTRKSATVIQDVLSYDVDVFKYGMHVMRFAHVAVDDLKEELDYAGYYYILKGTPQKNIPLLKRLTRKKDLLEVSVEKTKANNTRVYCYF